MLNTLINKIFIPIRRDKSVYVLSLLVCTLTYVLAKTFRVPQQFQFTTYFRSFAFATAGTLVLFYVVYYFSLLFRLEPHPLKQFWFKLILIVRHWPEIINFLLMMFSLSVVLSCFTSLKTAIPAIVPYYLDPYLANLDNYLHFGHPPWTLTHALFTSPWATATVNFFYNIWFFVVWGFLVFSMVVVWRPQLRQRMLIANSLVWFINGGILAIVLSSAGPPYAERLFPHLQDFRPLFSLLHSQNDFLLQQGTMFNVWALEVQEKLWQTYQNNQMAIGAGISAMPSVHVSTTTLIALALGAFNKKLGVIGWGYVAVIELGSIHLGWHYAVDGYLGILITIIIWKLVGLWQRHYHTTDTISRYE